MDAFDACVLAYKALLDIGYDFTVGAKGKVFRFRICFDKESFYHVAGLHYVSDIQSLKNRKQANEKIFSGEINGAQIMRSVHYHEIANRLQGIARLERMIDENKIVFQFNTAIAHWSKIKAKYLLADDNGMLVFLDGENNDLLPVSLFHPESKDYCTGQKRLTTLKIVKRWKKSGVAREIYRSKAYKENIPKDKP